MTVEQLNGWITAAAVLVQAGSVLIGTVRDLVRAGHPGATDAELDQILDAIATDAQRRAVLARLDKAQAAQDAAAATEA